MTWRGRKQRGWIRFSFGARSLGASVGIPGARIGLNTKRGFHRTLGVPGTGIYHTRYAGGTHSPRLGLGFWILLALALLLAYAAILGLLVILLASLFVLPLWVVVRVLDRRPFFLGRYEGLIALTIATSTIITVFGGMEYAADKTLAGDWDESSVFLGMLGAMALALISLGLLLNARWKNGLPLIYGFPERAGQRLPIWGADLPPQLRKPRRGSKPAELDPPVGPA